MANIYVNSVDGGNADNGSTWALAKATLTGAAAIDAAGDTIYVSDNHAESPAGSITLSFAGTLASPTRLLCVDDSAEPPTALATTASVAVTGANNITIGGCLYAYGIFFNCQSILTLCDASTNSAQTYERCKFKVASPGSAGALWLASSGNITAKTTLIDCTFVFGHVNNTPITCTGDGTIRGGNFESGTATPGSGVFQFALDRTAGRLVVDGLDFSNLGSTVSLFRGGSAPVASGKAILRNCKLPASWSGSLMTTAPNCPGQRYEMWNCDSGDTNYRLWIADYAGEIKQSSAVYKDSFAGGTKHSYVFVSSANAEYPLIRLEGPDFFADNATTGSSVTATVEIVTDNVTLKDDECWLEVMYMGTSGVPLGTWVTDCKADVLATDANQATSTETWTTTGLTTPVKQKLTISFTPQEAGYVIGHVVLAKASTTVYVDPELVLA